MVPVPEERDSHIDCCSCILSTREEESSLTELGKNTSLADDPSGMMVLKNVVFYKKTRITDSFVVAMIAF